MSSAAIRVLEDALTELGYDQSPSYARLEAFGRSPQHAHLLRQAVRTCALHGAYTLRNPGPGFHTEGLPVVYVAHAESEQEASDIHRRTWNQSLVPFLLVAMPKGLRLYSGFEYRASHANVPDRGILEPLVELGRVREKLNALTAHAMDSGLPWRDPRLRIDPRRRVDWRLLDNLKSLAIRLCSSGKVDPSIQALIGKYVYLRYLRDRGLLTDERMESWGVPVSKVFGRSAEMASFARLWGHLETWLNGGIFPLPLTGSGAPADRQLAEVSAVFLGDDPATGQLHLDFRAYDFSHIPVETLSVVYELFLAESGGQKPKGAYYTPVPLVNYMVSEMDGVHPLGTGTTVLDPSCGSGAFLVQCYRRIVERARTSGEPLDPRGLRDLLTGTIFGVERDAGACQVTSLGLQLTLLDNLEGVDLKDPPAVRLPSLIGRNLFVQDFFDDEPDPGWSGRRYDWVIGNPPWLKPDPKERVQKDAKVATWMAAASRSGRPVVRHSVAEAFAWKSLDHLAPAGAVGFLLPAMTLFDSDSSFRKAFFSKVQFHGVANLTNLREVLFEGRARSPSVALLFTSDTGEDDSVVPVFSPFLINQEVTRPESGERRDSWTLLVDGSEIQDVPRAEIVEGDPLPWKLAMWGSWRDRRLLRRISGKHPTLADFCARHGLHIAEGPQLRTGASDEDVEPAPEAIGKPLLNMEKLRGLRHVYSIDPEWLDPVPEKMGYVRAGRGEHALRACRPPHILISAARSFSVYADQYVVVPARQIGISGPLDKAQILRALSVYTGATFARYFQFFLSPQWGVRGELGTLDALKNLPVPARLADPGVLEQLSTFQKRLAECRQPANLTLSPLARTPSTDLSHSFPWHPPDSEEDFLPLEKERDSCVSELLGLRETESWLIEDLVDIRLSLIDGRVTDEASRPPTEPEIMAYAEALCHSLAAFMGSTPGRSPVVRVLRSPSSGLIRISLDGQRATAELVEPTSDVGHTLEVTAQKLWEQHTQWLYFSRNLLVLQRDEAFFLKPLQRARWTRSQALLDADEFISTALGKAESA